MTASKANGFAQIIFDPKAKTCASRPYAFHPMFASSDEHTHTSWAAHVFNVGFSDEIGHFEYCNDVIPTVGGAPPFGTCKKGDSDDDFCFPPSASTLVRVGGCQGTDLDADGVPYRRSWPGSLSDIELDEKLHPQPVRFRSPTFNEGEEYHRVAFETDTPSFESYCDFLTGKDCTVVPKGARFYPIYTTHGEDDACDWQLGGAHLPDTLEAFGGSAESEYGALLAVSFPAGGFQPIKGFADYRRVEENHCKRER
jgi:hypothetical protein